MPQQESQEPDRTKGQSLNFLILIQKLNRLISQAKGTSPPEEINILPDRMGVSIANLNSEEGFLFKRQRARPRVNLNESLVDPLESSLDLRIPPNLGGALNVDQIFKHELGHLLENTLFQEALRDGSFDTVPTDNPLIGETKRLAQKFRSDLPRRSHLFGFSPEQVLADMAISPKTAFPPEFNSIFPGIESLRNFIASQDFNGNLLRLLQENQ